MKITNLGCVLGMIRAVPSHGQLRINSLAGSPRRSVVAEPIEFGRDDFSYSMSMSLSMSMLMGGFIDLDEFEIGGASLHKTSSKASKPSGPTPAPTPRPTKSRTKGSSKAAKLYDVNPPNCTNESELDGIAIFSGGANDGDGTGIASVTLIDGAENLNLTVDAFTIGNRSVTFEATRKENTLPANGTILVTDQVGFNCTLDVSLEPFDFELFDEQTGFPARLHKGLFGIWSKDKHPVYDMTQVIREAAGMYQAVNEDGTTFFVQISSIVIPSSELITDVLEDATQELIDAVNAESVSLFAFRGFFHFGGVSIEAVVQAFTISGSSHVTVIYDPTDFFGITDETDEVDVELEFPDTDPTPLDDTETIDPVFPSQLRSSNELALVPHGRHLQAESCSNALNEAIEAANCEAPEQPYVNQPCVSAATFAFNTAVAAAQGKYDTAITIAKGIYYAVMIELNRRRIKDFAKSLIPCVLVGILSGPLGYALCAARALAIAIAKMMALKLAAKAALELAKRNAEATLRAALFAACNIFRAALSVCVRCVECGDPQQQPCGDACYDPSTQKCCPEEAVAAKDSCCPSEKTCPNGSCIPQDSCCPDEKECNGGCIPKKDCCQTPNSRKLLRGFEEHVISRRKLEEDPCCTDPNDECCGSDDECCGSDDPCCGSNDQCCGSTDPCCGSSDGCCGLPDCGGSSGDPHMTTFDGLSYDCQGRGEFILFAAGDTVAQARFKKSGRVALTTGVAVSEGPGSTKVEVSISVDLGGPVLVVDGATITPPSLGYEDSSVIVVSTSGTFRITYKSSTLSIFVRHYGSYMNVNVGLPQALRDLGTVGLLGSADNDPTNDWMMPNGTALELPPSQSDRIGLPSLDYCLDNWCNQDESASLFTYYEEKYNFTYFSGCNDLDRDTVDISNPTAQAAELCGVDKACLVDFIEVGQEVAKDTLVETAKLDAVFTTNSLVAKPATIAANGKSVNVVLSIDTVGNGLGIEEFAVYRVDSVTGGQIGVQAALKLVGDANGVFSRTINVVSNQAGEVFGFRAVPVFGGAEDPASPATILRLVTVRSFSDGSGVVQEPINQRCPAPCDDGNPCTIDFCLNSVCRTEPVACEIGTSCDSFSGRCLDVENLVPCVAVIDEWDGRAYNNEWAVFRQRFPQRPFCLLVPNNGIETLPTGFDADTVNNPDGIDRTIVQTVNRDNGNVNAASDWTSICSLGALTPQNTQFVGLFVDDSGSMRVDTVRASLNKFEADMAALGLEIRRVVNGVERWVDPFLTDLIPAGAAAPAVSEEDWVPYDVPGESI